MTDSTAVELSRSRTLWDLITRRAAMTPDAPVLIEAADGPAANRATDRRLTFAELRDRSEQVAAGLYGMGVRPGTVVAWQLPTRIETVLLSVALARIGAVQTPVIPFYRDREVGFALRESKAEFFAVPGVWRGFDHTAMAHRLGAHGVFEAYESLPTGDPAVLPPPPRRASRSGGSTGPRAPPPTPRASCTRTAPSSRAAPAWPTPCTCHRTTSARWPSRSPTSPDPTTR